MDWLMWVATGLGTVAFFSSKTIFYCLGTDPNFGWIQPVDYSNLEEAVISPWTQDFLISIVSLVTGIKSAIFDYSKIDPFFVAKKVAQGVWGCLLKGI